MRFFWAKSISASQPPSVSLWLTASPQGKPRGLRNDRLDLVVRLSDLSLRGAQRRGNLGELISRTNRYSSESDALLLPRNDIVW